MIIMEQTEFRTDEEKTRYVKKKKGELWDKYHKCNNARGKRQKEKARCEFVRWVKSNPNFIDAIKKRLEKSKKTKKIFEFILEIDE